MCFRQRKTSVLCQIISEIAQIVENAWILKLNHLSRETVVSYHIHTRVFLSIGFRRGTLNRVLFNVLYFWWREAKVFDKISNIHSACVLLFPNNCLLSLFSSLPTAGDKNIRFDVPAPQLLLHYVTREKKQWTMVSNRQDTSGGDIGEFIKIRWLPFTKNIKHWKRPLLTVSQQKRMNKYTRV